MSWAEIARRVGRHSTTVAREVNANGGRRGYPPAVADRRALKCRRRRLEPVVCCATGSPRNCAWAVPRSDLVANLVATDTERVYAKRSTRPSTMVYST